MISDHRAIALLSLRAETLLVNQGARRVGLTQISLTQQLNWPALCEKARRAGRTPLQWQAEGQSLDGELIFLPMDPVETFYLRLSEGEHETLMLRNRARAANLMRVAHDLRTPIQALLAASQGILSHDDGDNRDQAAPRRAALRRAAELSLDQINAVLATIRGEGRVKGVRPDDNFCIAAEVENLLSMLAPIAASRSTEIVPQIEVPAGLMLRGPLPQLRALFQNLIDNSVNHGGGKVALRLSCTPLKGGVIEDSAPGDLWAVALELADEGGGMAPAQRDRLLAALQGQPGTTAPEAAKRQSAGLHVLAHALAQLGGKLEIYDRGVTGQPLAKDSPERVIGTLFKVSFSLPRAVPAHAETTSPAQTSCAAIKTETDPVLPHGSNALRGKCLLLVEDSPSARDWLKHVLESAGAEVFAVGSGPEALALLSRSEEAERIDLLLSDVTLPHMSGIELCARIRRGDPTAAQNWAGPIIGLTAHADDLIRDAGMRAGMTFVLEKPIQPKILVQRLTEVLQGDLPEDAGALKLDGEVIDQDVLRNLSDQMGAGAMRGFMQRALSEAEMVMVELARDGIVADSGRRLHAATGACGLTGLRLVETNLRDLEKAVVQAPDRVPSQLTHLAQAVNATTMLLAELA